MAPEGSFGGSICLCEKCSATKNLGRDSSLYEIVREQNKGKICPSCGSLQIQLTHWLSDITWRCREDDCKHAWCSEKQVPTGVFSRIEAALEMSLECIRISMAHENKIKVFLPFSKLSKSYQVTLKDVELQMVALLDDIKQISVVEAMDNTYWQEGLPPVGSSCEFHIHSTKWARCSVVAHDTIDNIKVAVVRYDEDYHAASEKVLRPITNKRVDNA